MLASAQKSGKAHTNATEWREDCLAITENKEKKDIYPSPFHVNQLMVYEDRLFRSIPRKMSAENVVSRRNPIILITILDSVIQFAAYSGAITRLYRSIYIRKDGTM